MDEEKNNERPGDSNPMNLDVLEKKGVFEGFDPPVDAFDPSEGWTHGFRLHWIVLSRKNAIRNTYCGYLEIHREPTPQRQGIVLKITHAALQSVPTAHITKAEIMCANDPLASPLEWKSMYTVSDNIRSFRPSVVFRAEHSGKLEENRVRINYGGCPKVIEVSGPLTTGWSLFDAVQRLPRTEDSPLAFNLLQDLDLFKPSQQLVYRGKSGYTLNGRSLRLHRWQQTGRAVLPFTYYTDEDGRLLTVTSGQIIYLFHPNVPKYHNQFLRGLQGKAGK